MLSERERRVVAERLKALEQPVRLVNFTQELECAFCRETRELLEDVVALSDRLSLQVYNFQLDRAQVTAYGVDKIPATVVEGDRDWGIRFYGIPSGYEFATLLEIMLAASRRRSGLQPSTVERLRAVNRPLHLQVFVTPT